MHRARTAEAGKREITRVAPAVGKREPDSLSHVFGADRDDSLRRRYRLEPDALADC